MHVIARAKEAIDALSKALKDGNLHVEGAETVVKAKFEEIPQVWGRLFTGHNTGKLITQIADL